MNSIERAARKFATQFDFNEAGHLADGSEARRNGLDGDVGVIAHRGRTGQGGFGMVSWQGHSLNHPGESR